MSGTVAGQLRFQARSRLRNRREAASALLPMCVQRRPWGSDASYEAAASPIRGSVSGRFREYRMFGNPARMKAPYGRLRNKRASIGNSAEVYGSASRQSGKRHNRIARKFLHHLLVRGHDFALFLLCEGCIDRIVDANPMC